MNTADKQQNFTAVSRDVLLDKLRSNRATHERELDESLRGWRVVYLEELRKIIGRLSGFIPEIAIDPARVLDYHEQRVDLPREPESHLKEYDMVIARLEMSTDEIHHVSHDNFSAWVINEWEWTDTHREQFKRNSRALHGATEG